MGETKQMTELSSISHNSYKYNHIKHDRNMWKLSNTWEDGPRLPKLNDLVLSFLKNILSSMRV